MNELIVQTSKLPDTMKELARFVLVGREKINAVRAEIRAIDKLKLAEDVREQKRKEVSMLSETLLDAEIRLGELFKQIPKATKGNQYTGRMKTDSGVALQKCKKEIISELGFSEKQAERLEILANNGDLAEYVKAEARENDEIPTRARVLELVSLKRSQNGESDNSDDYPIETRILDMTEYQKKQEAEFDEYDVFQDLRVKMYKDFLKMIDVIADFDITDYKMNALRDNFDAVLTVEEHIGYITESIEKLNIIKSEIWKGKKRI